MAHVPIGYQHRPDLERLYSGRPANAADGVRLLNTLLHLAGWRHRRLTTYTVEVDHSAVEGPTVGIAPHPNGPPGPVAAATEHHFVHRVLPTATHLWVALDYQAADEGTGVAQIDLQVFDMSAVLVDRGVRWRRDDGTLPAEKLSTGAGVFTAYYHPIQTIHTGARLPTNAEVTGAAPSGPRLLDVTVPAATGALVDVLVTTTNARLVSATIWDWPGDPPELA